MPTETGRNTRTIRGYVENLLEYPRWLIEREVDFSACGSGGHFNEYLETCAACHFGAGCRWLDQMRAPSMREAELDELLAALDGAVRYFSAPDRARDSLVETRAWLREAQRFLGSRQS